MTATDELIRDAARRLRHCKALGPFRSVEHYDLYLDRACRLVVAVRTPVPFVLLFDIKRCFDGIEDALQPVPRERYTLLLDTRCGPTRNDDSFEVAYQEHWGKLLRDFSKRAALATSAAGRLQIQRYARHSDHGLFVTEQPERAFEYLGLPPHDVAALQI